EENIDERTVLSMPYAQADTVSLRDADAERLAEVVRAHGEQAWEDAGIVPRAAAQRIDGPTADAGTLDSVLATGGTAAIVPSSSLRSDPASSVTPSSVGVYSAPGEDGGDLALLAPDPQLSDEFSHLTADSDAEQLRQRLLAETATVASAHTTPPRPLLISPSAAAPLDPAAPAPPEDAWTQVHTLAAAMEDDAPLEARRREIIAGTSTRWRGQPEIPAARAQDASEIATSLQDRIEVVPASGYNVISDEVSVPITIRNGLDTPITVRVAVTSDKPLVQVGEPIVVEVPARGQADAAVDVEAIANGTVTLTTVVTSTDGQP